MPIDLRKAVPEGYMLIDKRQSTADAGFLLEELDGYPKFQSVVAFWANRLPAKEAFFVWDITDKVRAAIRGYLSDKQLNKVLIRSEKRGGNLISPSRQAVPAENVCEEVEILLAEDPEMLIAIQPAGDILHNSYNINLEMSRVDRNRFTFEIAGPGFTATDLNRSGVTHERIKAPCIAEELSEPLLERIYRVSSERYAEHRREKINEIGKKAKERMSKPDSQENLMDIESEEELGLEILRREKGLLLEFPSYQRIPVSFLQTVWADRDAMEKVVGVLGHIRFGAIFSLSFLVEDRQTLRHYYWDVHPAMRF